jgi:hypothetical protein
MSPVAEFPHSGYNTVIFDLAADPLPLRDRDEPGGARGIKLLS